MSYTLEELYKIQRKDMKNACKILGAAFQDDPTWIHIIPDINQRKKKLPTVFEYVVRYSLKYGQIYAPTETLEGVAAWKLHTTVDPSLWRILRSGAFLAAAKMGSEIGRRIQNLFDVIDKDRREHMRDRSYLYLQVIGVLPEFQGKGFGGRLLKPMFAKVDIEGFPIYLETETEKNTQIYSKYGFVTLKERRAPNADFNFWEMVREPQ